MIRRLVFACTAVLSLSFSAALASVTFDGSPGTAAPPSTLGGYTMTAFGADPQSTFTAVSSVAGPNGNIGFSPSLTHVTVGSGWATWSNGYTGDVYSTGGTSVTISMPANTLAFYFYAEPNVFSTFSMSAVSDNGTSSGPVSVAGFAGARYFGFYATGGDKISSITVSCPSAALGFAVGEFGIYQCTPPTISVSLSPNVLWPPNHKYVDITASVTTSGSCGSLTVQLVSVTSNEADNGLGDGDTPNDIDGATTGTADYAFRVRAERSGLGTGRIYTATYQVTDALGNTATASATISVPLSQGKSTLGMEEWNGVSLSQNYPNPVRSATTINFSLKDDRPIQMAIVDVMGRTVRTLPLGDLTAGEHSAVWDGLDDAGVPVPAGHYVYRLIGVDCGCATSRTMNVVR